MSGLAVRLDEARRSKRPNIPAARSARSSPLSYMPNPCLIFPQCSTLPVSFVWPLQLLRRGCVQARPIATPSSFPRRRESISCAVDFGGKQWIPAFAGMTTSGKIETFTPGRGGSQRGSRDGLAVSAGGFVRKGLCDRCAPQNSLRVNSCKHAHSGELW